ncbi:hypothetical protein [Brevibacillus sp. NRS-1366]|uniref:hypothetical protein n=1 Tax=Brevibacillus sp. NRS-1366 TaxID=3233899 RepID=UPI003D1C8865
MNVQQKCAKCRSTKIDFTEMINRRLYTIVYVFVLAVLAVIGISLKGTPVIFLFLGLTGACVLFAFRLYLEKRKVVKCVCLDCGQSWETSPSALAK